MTFEIANKSPYIPDNKKFSENFDELSNELTTTYSEIAEFINARKIGIYPTNKPAFGGDTWFLAGVSKQTNLRQVYIFTAAGNIPHGINITRIYGFANCYGSYTDGTDWYGVIFGSSTTIAGQVSFYIDSTNIVVQADAGAPAISSGIIVLEWISNV